MVATIEVSWSEIDAFRQCPMKHRLAYKERWSPPGFHEALARGIAWHDVMAEHYRGIAEGETLDQIIHGRVLPLLKPMAADDDQATQDRAKLLAWMYDGYTKAWGLDEGIKIRAVEHQSRIRLLTPSGAPSRFLVKMRVDLVAEDAYRKLWLWDHKSHARIPSDRELDLDDQFGLYVWGLRQAGRPVIGAIYNTARTQRNQSPMALDERFKRSSLVRTDTELDTIAMEAYRTLDKAYRAGAFAERNPDPERCRWRCPFTEPCLFGRKYGDDRMTEFLQDAGFVIDPTRH